MTRIQTPGLTRAELEAALADYIGTTDTAYDSARLGGVNALLYQTAAQASAAYVVKVDQLNSSTVHRTTALALVAATETNMVWTAVADGDATFWNSGTPGKVVIPAGKGGMYQITAVVPFSGVASAGTVRVTVTVNLTNVLGDSRSVAASDIPVVSTSKPVRLAAGDEVRVGCYSSNARDVSPFIVNAQLSLVRIGT